jgi:hypothetical protein
MAAATLAAEGLTYAGAAVDRSGIALVVGSR